MSAYGEGCAEFYDELYGPAQANVVQALSGLVAGGSALELGLGTGRTALALRARCARLVGIESSAAMRAQLAAKPGAQHLTVVAGDFSRVRLAERFDLVYVLVDTFFLLEGAAAQRRCLTHVRAMLAPGGVFVLEGYAAGAAEAERPDADGAVAYRRRVPTARGPRDYAVRLYRQDLVTLDALARQAGLALRERWSNWRGTPHRPDAPMHVSLYGCSVGPPPGRPARTRDVRVPALADA